MFKSRPRYTIRDSHGKQIQVDLRRDKRLKKTSRWERLPDGSVLLRVPYRYPNHHISALLDKIATQIDRLAQARPRRTDADLQRRAEAINRMHFDGKLQWNAIRWVSNMHSRLGSCTRGGATDGEIRISDKIRQWPGWVIDYVIAHELMHRKHSNHSQTFWDELKTAYPLTERARGFIHGASFTMGQPLDEDQDDSR